MSARNWGAAVAAAIGMVLLAPMPADAKKPKEPEAPVDIGPEPDFVQARAAAETLLKSSMFDPDSAQFKWDHGFTGGFYKPVLAKKKYGWWTCGLLNGRNRLGGYVGFRSFVVVVRYGQVVYNEVGSGGNYDFTAGACAKALSQGLLPSRPETADTQPAAVASGGAPSVADEIAKLAALRDKGILSEAEFQQQKNNLLNPR